MSKITLLNAVVKELLNTELVYDADLRFGELVFSTTDYASSGNHWAFESEIFWKARGDNL